MTIVCSCCPYLQLLVPPSPGVSTLLLQAAELEPDKSALQLALEDENMQLKEENKRLRIMLQEASVQVGG